MQQQREKALLLYCSTNVPQLAHLKLSTISQRMKVEK